MLMAFSEWIRAYGSANLAKDLGLSRSTVQKWAQGTRQPHIELVPVLVKLADGRVTLEDICGYVPTPKNNYPE